MRTINYDRSLLALVSSVLSSYGVTTNHKTLPELDKLLKTERKNVVVMLFDGMGSAILEKHLPSDDFLRRHFVGSVSSVFPPTTTAATTTVNTGLTPAEHGWLGWSLYFSELDKTVDCFPNVISGSQTPAAGYNVARRFLPSKSIYKRIEEATDGKVKAEYVSPFSKYKSQSIEEICDTVKRLCDSGTRSYIHTYWAQPDYDMHDLGVSHPRITEHILEINRLVEELCSELTDTLVIVTADHGLVDVRWKFLSDYPDITECLVRRPSIEARALSFFVRDGLTKQFKSAFLKHFGDCYELYTKAEVQKSRLFGGGIQNSLTDGFIGDFVAVAISDTGIEASPNADRNDMFKAAHAGFTDDELNVPFIVIETP